MSTHIVYGNGESRVKYKEQIDKLPKAITWGCNAIYRDKVVDNLVSVDYNMQQEIYQSGYPMKNKCWFADWSLVPSEFNVEYMKEGFEESQIYETPYTDEKFLVVQGKRKEDVQYKFDQFIMENPTADKSDIWKKVSSDIGLYITWVKPDDDKVIDINFPKGWSAGNTAIHLACQQGAKEVYMVGFDSSSYNENINNVYKGSKNYLPKESRGFNPINWNNQLKTIFNEYSDVSFYWLMKEDLQYDGLFEQDSFSNLRYLTYENIR